MERGKEKEVEEKRIIIFFRESHGRGRTRATFTLPDSIGSLGAKKKTLNHASERSGKEREEKCVCTCACLCVHLCVREGEE